MDTLVRLGIQAQAYIPDVIARSLTKKVCPRIGNSRSTTLKRSFVDKYKINLRMTRKCAKADTIDDCIAKFDTVNDLFARKILAKYTRPDTTRATAIVSPAECEARIEPATNRFTIKEAQYSLAELLDKPNPKVPQQATVYIFRLEPQHYHRFHSPIASKITNIHSAGNNYASVHPLLLDKLPVLQTNYRKILTFENGMFLVIIGATCVGSIELDVKKGDTVKHGQDLGAFKFGGSCVVLVVPHKITAVKTTLGKKERPLRVGKYIADFEPMPRTS